MHISAYVCTYTCIIWLYIGVCVYWKLKLSLSIRPNGTCRHPCCVRAKPCPSCMHTFWIVPFGGTDNCMHSRRLFGWNLHGLACLSTHISTLNCHIYNCGCFRNIFITKLLTVLRISRLFIMSTMWCTFSVFECDIYHVLLYVRVAHVNRRSMSY